METTDRIYAIANKIEYRTFVDVGTDHALLPIFAVESGRVDSCIATDINEGPISTAKENIQLANLECVIETRLGDGLETISAGEAETVVISGMGGKLIIEILEKGMEQAKSAKQLVLSPHLDIESVRRFVHTIGFRIKDEEMVRCKNKFYNILNCVRGVDEFYSDVDYLLGKHVLRKCNATFSAYIKHELQKLETIKTNILSNNEMLENKETRARLEKTLCLMKIYRNANCYSNSV